MNILETILINCMYYFGATYLFSMSDSILVARIFFSDMYTPHCYRIANTPILQSRNPAVSFPSFVLTSQVVPILFFSLA